MFNLKVGSVSCNNVEIYTQMCSPSHTDTSVESASLSSYNDLTEVIEKKLQRISKYHAPENCDRNNFRGLKEKEKEKFCEKYSTTFVANKVSHGYCLSIVLASPILIGPDFAYAAKTFLRIGVQNIDFYLFLPFQLLMFKYISIYFPKIK